MFSCCTEEFSLTDTPQYIQDTGRERKEREEGEGGRRREREGEGGRGREREGKGGESKRGGEMEDGKE